VSKEPIYQWVGARIREAREAAGLTQEALASRLKPPQTRASIANMEGGNQRILLHTLFDLSRALGVNLESLVRPMSAGEQAQRRRVDKARARLQALRREALALRAQIKRRGKTCGRCGGSGDDPEEDGSCGLCYGRGVPIRPG
jgi:transcriptional regulator with XRE-family HTH domain